MLGRASFSLRRFLKIGRSSLGRASQLAAIVLCLVFAFQGHPPAIGQATLSVKDAQQDDAIQNLREETDLTTTEMARRVQKNEDSQQRIWDAIRTIQATQAGNQGETRYEFGGLASLIAAPLLLGRRKKKEPSE